MGGLGVSIDGRRLLREGVRPAPQGNGATRHCLAACPPLSPQPSSRERHSSPPTTALTPRLVLRRALLSTAAAVVSGPLLAACSSAAAARLVAVVRPADLTVDLVGGATVAPSAAYAVPHGFVQGLVAPLQKALATDRKAAAEVGALTFETHNAVFQWFQMPPTPTPLGLNPSVSMVREFDPPGPVPDVTVAESDLFPDYLSLLALDLQPYLGAVPPRAALRQGRFFAGPPATSTSGAKDPPCPQPLTPPYRRPPPADAPPKPPSTGRWPTAPPRTNPTGGRGPRRVPKTQVARCGKLVVRLASLAEGRLKRHGCDWRRSVPRAPSHGA